MHKNNLSRIVVVVKPEDKKGEGSAKTKKYRRAAIFGVTENQARAASDDMMKEATSWYNLYTNNCGYAVSNTFEHIGLNGAYVKSLVPSPGGYATGQYCNPMPNVMYSNMIENNRATLVTEIIK